MTEAEKKATARLKAKVATLERKVLAANAAAAQLREYFWRLEASQKKATARLKAKVATLERKVLAANAAAAQLREYFWRLEASHKLLADQVSRIVLDAGNIHDVAQNVDIWLNAVVRLEDKIKSLEQRKRNKK